MIEEYIEFILAIGKPIIIGVLVASIVKTALRIALNLCRGNWAEIKEEEEIKMNIDEDLKEYYNYKVE